MSTLEMYFKKREVQCDDDDLKANEDVIEGEYWEFKEPERVEAWSLFIIPFIDDMTLSYKFKSAQVYLQLSFQAKVKDVEADANPIVKIKCMTTIPEVEKKNQYHFFVFIDSVLIPFNLSPFLTNLEPTSYSSEIKELETKLDRNKWKNANGTPLNWKKLCNKIWHLFTDFHTLKGKLQMQGEINKPWSVSKGPSKPSKSQTSRPLIAQESGSSRGYKNSQNPTEKTPQRKGKEYCSHSTDIESTK